MAMHVDFVSCQILAKALKILGRKTLDVDHIIAQKRIREQWAPKPNARHATFHAHKFLEPFVDMLVCINSRFVANKINPLSSTSDSTSTREIAVRGLGIALNPPIFGVLSFEVLPDPQPTGFPNLLLVEIGFLQPDMEKFGRSDLRPYKTNEGDFGVIGTSLIFGNSGRIAQD